MNTTTNNSEQHIVRFGRTEGFKVTKTTWHRRRRDALHLANSISMMLFGEHAFKASECTEVKVVERDGFWIEYKLNTLN